MRLGDTVMACPTLLSLKTDGTSGQYDPIPGKVVFVHPENRFYTLEFYFRNNYVRECFDFPAEVKEEGRDYANYCYHERKRRRRENRHNC